MKRYINSYICYVTCFVNMLNKLLAADNMWPSSFVVGLMASWCKNVAFCELSQGLGCLTDSES
jgi:hypothetical protein